VPNANPPKSRDEATPEEPLPTAQDIDRLILRNAFQRLGPALATEEILRFYGHHLLDCPKHKVHEFHRLFRDGVSTAIKQARKVSP